MNRFFFSYLRDESGSVHPSQRKQHFFRRKKTDFLAPRSFSADPGGIGPGRAAYATVIFPVFALLISALYEGYEWTWLALAGLALVMAGNMIMIRARG